MSITVLIADDYFLIREGIKNSIKNLKDIQLLGEARNTDELLQMLGNFKPDIIILEINLCEQSVRDVLASVRNISPASKVLIISDCSCELPVLISIKSGISGFIRKNISKEELTVALRSIAKGSEYYSSDITQVLTQAYSPASLNYGISERELEILRYICKGRSNEQIADILFISEKTVGTHRKNIMKKAGVRKSSELIVWAMENKVVKN